MAYRTAPIDKFFLVSVSTLTIFGFIIFLSASLGLLAQGGASFGSIAMKQTASLFLGVVSFYIFSRIKYSWLQKSALFIFIGAVFINLLLFLPQLSHFHGGASRWIDLGLFSFQPSELLKISFIIYLAAWIHFAKDKITSIKYGLLVYSILMVVLGALLLAQRDTDTFVIICATGIIMFFVAGVPLKQIMVAVILMVALVFGVLFTRPYAMQRVQTFLNHNKDTQGAGYQINQSLIAIGSGQILGRGIGQSIQKFGYLPQPTDDSIFAVAAEEFGFVGSIVLITMYILLTISIFRISINTKDIFGSFVAFGIAILVIIESFLNIAAMLGLIPLSGVPILFVSHGGTALIISLAAMGIVANVSKKSYNS